MFGQIFAVPGKGLAVTGHYRAGSQPHTTGIWLAYSADDGRTWGQPQRILEQHLVEPSILFAQDRFIGLIRNGRDASYYWQLAGDAAGQSWQLTRSNVASDNANDYRFPSPCLLADPEQPRRLYALESNRHAHGTNLPGRVALWTAELPKLEWQRLGTLIRWPETARATATFRIPG